MTDKKERHNNGEKKSGNKKLVLLDAHAIIHRAYHALPDFSTAKGEPTGGLYGVAAMLIKIINDQKPDYIVACYDLPEPTFRHEAYDAYKAGRDKAPDDLILQINRSRDIFRVFNIPIYEAAGFEADDILGTIVYQLRSSPVDIVIASGDMDTLQLVDKSRVKVYTLRKGLSDTVLYDENAVMERFGFAPKLLPDFKGLRGDPSDNIIGITGIGEKTATALIQLFGSIENIYGRLDKNRKDFTDAGIKERIIKLLEDGREEAEFSKTLAKIRYDAPVSFTLPDRVWSDGFKISDVEALFMELEFKTLFARLRRMYGIADDGSAPKSDVDTSDRENNLAVGEDDITYSLIAMWLINSEMTSPTVDDVLRHTKEKTFIAAKESIMKEIKQFGLEYMYENIEIPLVPIVRRMQEYGIAIDIKYLAKLSRTYHKELSEIERRIWDASGEEFNINSPKQIGEVLFDKMEISAKGLKKTAGGARSTRESELMKLADEHKIVRDILLYRELQKLLSTYIDNLPKMADSHGRVHAVFNQTGTATGRFSSSNPNMQNIPTRDEKGNAVRNAFISGKGNTLIAFDYSQIEMRVLASLSEDSAMIDAFNKGEDIHSSVASRVFGVGEKDVNKEMRRKAKVINFGIVYGMGINALRANLGGSRAEAQEFYNLYFKKFPRIAAYFDNVKKSAAENGFTKTLFGRRRHFAGIYSPIQYIRSAAERQAINAPIQGTASDIIKIAMKKIDDAISKAGLGENVNLVLQVHDELIYEVDDKYIERATDLIKHNMESAVAISVPLVVNVSSGKRWGELL